ncbi:MAG: helix-turn-helix domain-containing protein [Bacteroidetes bacterium]|nr:helix-turn-helix domain-containing protein [Bacteroidota bacterium]
MKVVAFNVPRVKREAFRLQTDRGRFFYDQLHQHSEIQIMLICEGEGTLIAGDYVGRFRAHDLYVIGSNQAHVFRSDEHYYSANSKKKSNAISIYFNEQYLGDSFWQLDEMKTLKIFFNRSIRGMKISGQTKSEITELIFQLKTARGIDKLILFFLILKKLSRTRDIKNLSIASGDFKKEEGKRMNAIIRFTFRESHRPIYLEEVAEVANLTVEAFCRYFKQHTQKTYTSFLNEVRVSNACRLLINKDITMRDVCYRAGFNNLSNFNRIFRRIAGTRPSEYVS